MIEPWERRDNETDPAWEAFRTYRDMGSARSTSKVAQALSKTKQLMDGWSGTHEWVERCRQFDRHMDRAAVAQHQKRVDRLMGQQLELSEKLLRRLSRNLDLQQDGEDPTMRWSTAYAAGTRSQREALSEVKPAAQKELEEQADAMVDLAKFVARVTKRGRSDQGE